MSPRVTRATLSWCLLPAVLAMPLAAWAEGGDDGGEDAPPEGDSDGDGDCDWVPEADPALATHGLISLVSGAGLLAAGAITGGIALHLNAGLGDDCPEGLCPPDRRDDLRTRNALATSSTVLFGAGLVTTALGILILAVFAPDVEAEEPPGTAEPSSASLHLLPGPGSLALEVRF